MNLVALPLSDAELVRLKAQVERRIVQDPNDHDAELILRLVSEVLVARGADARPRQKGTR